MKKSPFRSILIVLAVLLLAGWCYLMVSPSDTPPPEEIAPADYGPTSTLASTSTPDLVGFDTVCGTPAFEEVQVEGFLHMPDRVACATEGESDYCTVQLTDLVTRGHILVSLFVDGERDAPVPNHMVSLPIPYEATDLMLAAEDGQWTGEGGIVRLTGQVESYADSTCKLVDVSRVEKLEQFSLPDAQVRHATLRAAIRDGWIEVSIAGDGLSRIDLKVEPKMEFSLNLEIEAGTQFLAEGAGVQNMVVRKRSFVYVTPELEPEIELEVSCANMNKDEPGRTDTFTVLPDLAPQDLVALFKLAEFAFEPMRVQQFSVWTITDNPARDGYVGITASFSAEGSGPTGDELARIRDLFHQAGLDLTQYRALQEP